MRPLIVLSMILGGCTSTSFPATVYEDNKDVLILALLVQDHLKNTDGIEDNYTALIAKDTLNRISNCFVTVDLALKGGHISVYYKFSSLRNATPIQLTDQEKKLMNRIRWREMDYNNKYDGEIRLDYGERFYRFLAFSVPKQVHDNLTDDQ